MSSNFLCVRNYWGNGNSYFREGQSYSLPSNPTAECFTAGSRPTVTDPVYKGQVLTVLPDAARNYIR